MLRCLYTYTIFCINCTLHLELVIKYFSDFHIFIFLNKCKGVFFSLYFLYRFKYVLYFISVTSLPLFPGLLVSATIPTHRFKNTNLLLEL